MKILYSRDKNSIYSLTIFLEQCEPVEKILCLINFCLCTTLNITMDQILSVLLQDKTFRIIWEKQRYQCLIQITFLLLGDLVTYGSSMEDCGFRWYFTTIPILPGSRRTHHSECGIQYGWQCNRESSLLFTLLHDC